MTKEWAQQGHDITVIAGMYDAYKGRKFVGCKGKMFHRELYHERVRVIRAHTSEKYDKNLLWRAWAYFTFIFFGFFGGLFFAKGRYDVVLASSPPLTVGPLGIALSIIKRCPFIFEVRDLWPDGIVGSGVAINPKLMKIMYAMEKLSYRKARAINALTPAFVETLIKEKGISDSKIWMIPNGADLDIIKPGPVDNDIRARHNWGDKFVGLYIGAHGKMNYLWQLVESARILRDEPEYLIVCIGNGIERDKLMNAVKQEGLTNIQFLPAVSKKDIGLYLNSSDVSLIVLRKAEIMTKVYPNKMFDSMSAAKPIILAIDGVSRKVAIEEAKCGFYVEPENAREIADKIRFYRGHPEVARQHGENGYEFVCKHYDRRKLAAKYLQLIETNIINKK